jgi:hypothetical protein
MNCEELQTRLSDYLDKSLDTISTKSIEVHLASCPLCRAEAAALNDCIRQVSSLPTVDPPLGFAQRVMAHVREIEIRPPLWQRLFFPLKTKIPIQATAVVLIGALAVVLSQKQEQLKNQETPGTSVPAMTAANQLEKPKEAPSELAIVPKPDVRARASAEPTANKPTQLAKQFVDQAKPDKPQTPSPAADQTTSAPPASAKSEIESRADEKKEAPRRQPIQAQEVATGREVLRPSVDRFGVGAVTGGLSQPSLRAGPLAAERSLSPLGELNADVEFVVRRRAAQRLEQLRSGSADTAGQSAVAKRSAPAAAAPQSSSIAEIRWFTVQSDLYDRFKKELAAEASIESEKAAGVLENDFIQKSARELLIKVIILSPAER